MEVHNLLLFALASLSINLIPGPDVIYIVSNTMKGKMAGGMKAALGLGVGYFVHTLAATLGLSAIILNSALVPNSSPKCDTLQFKRLASFLQKPWLAA